MGSKQSSCEGLGSAKMLVEFMGVMRDTWIPQNVCSFICTVLRTFHKPNLLLLVLEKTFLAPWI